MPWSSSGWESSNKTPLAADIAPPVLLSGPTVRNVTATSAAIEWVTDEPANSILDYGTQPRYETGHIELGERAEVHVVYLTNLQAATTYHFKVSSADGSGNTVSSDPQDKKQHSRDHVLHTLREADILPPVFLEGPVVYPRDEAAVIEWQTDEPAGYEIVYDSEPTLDSPQKEVIQGNDLNERHSVRLTRLQRGRSYHYRLKVWDQDGNSRVATSTRGGRAAKLAQVVTGAGSFVTLLEPDTQYPVFLGLPRSSAATSTTLTIEWDTDELSDSQVEFGKEGEPLDQVEGSPLSTTHHRVVLTNLLPGQAYGYQVSSTDISGNGPAKGPPLMARTQAELDLTPPNIEGNPQLIGLTDTWATLEWVTDELSTSVVEYGAEELERRREAPELTRQHRLTVTNLLPDTGYRYRVSSTDGSQNGPVFSDELQFRTQAAPDLAAPQIVNGPRLVSRTNRTAILAWETDELADSFVRYGLRQEALEQSTELAEDVLGHRLVLTNLAPGTTYFYKVGSIDRNNNGPTESGVFQFTTAEFQDTLPPAVPTGLVARAGSESVWLSWSASPESDLAGYNVYRREVLHTRRLEDGIPPFSPVASLPEERFHLVATQVQEPGFLDRGLKNGAIYAYQVTALDNAFPPNESPLSPIVQTIPTQSKALRAPTARGAVSGPQTTTLEIYHIASGVGARALTYTLSGIYGLRLLRRGGQCRKGAVRGRRDHRLDLYQPAGKGQKLLVARPGQRWGIRRPLDDPGQL